MARRKNKQKEAEETLVDIVEVRDQASDFLEENRNLIIGGIVALVAIVGGYLGYTNFYQQPRQERAMQEMTQAQVQFERDSFTLALTNPGGGFSGFLDIIDNYGGTPAGNSALYYAGICYLNLGQYDAAIDYLGDFSAKGEIMPIMKNGAIGDAYSELQDFDKAMQYYKKAVAAGENAVLTAYYLKKLGLLHEKNGDFAQALKAYQRIKNDFPKAPESREIQKYITRTESKS